MTSKIGTENILEGDGSIEMSGYRVRTYPHDRLQERPRGTSAQL